MTKEREALKLALEALEIRCGTNAEERGPYGAITAIREALAQPEQEPVAWMTSTGALYRTEDVDGCFDDTHIPLYTTPPHRKPLTDEQRDVIARQAAENDWHDYEVIDAVEAAHGIKE